MERCLLVLYEKRTFNGTTNGKERKLTTAVRRETDPKAGSVRRGHSE